MDSLDHLAQLFSRFPGIGSRQSKRFVYFLLRQDRDYIEELARTIEGLRRDIRECNSCHRYFMEREVERLCSVCKDATRSNETILVVEKDSDLESFERAHAYKGQYFVLGGTLQILDRDPKDHIRTKQLLARIESLLSQGLKEVIIATSITPESEHTGDYVREMIQPYCDEHNIRTTVLGRGLSTGSELEYADPETLRYALEGRK